MASPQTVRQLLTMRGATPKGNQLVIRCPWHAGGQERTPSLFVNVDGQYAPGTFTCFGCAPQRSGNWRTLAVKLGIIADAGDDDEDADPWVAAISDDTVDAMLGVENTELHDMLIKEKLFPKNEKWRGIKGWLLHDLGARITAHNYSENRVYLPIVQNGAWRSGIFCTMQGNAKVKYLNEKGCPTSQLLFPYDYVAAKLKELPRNERIVCLVEGPRDALNWLQNDIMTLANIGGITVWSQAKVDLIIELNPTAIITAFDPDAVGKQLTKKAKEDLKPVINNIKRFKMYKTKNENGTVRKEDPGNLSDERMRYLKRCIRKMSKQ